MWTEINLLYPLVLTLTSLSVATLVSMHVVLYKRDVRAAIGWIGVIWLTPFIGSLLYLAFGINRVSRRAQQQYNVDPVVLEIPRPFLASETSVAETWGDEFKHLASLVRYGNNISGHPLVKSNSIEPLDDGDTAYREMLQAINGAKHSVSLSTYIFDNDSAGKEFVVALEAATKRGVEVRVLIDDVGVRYSFPSICHALRRAGIRHATFFPTLIPWKLHYSNLRNHRKLLVADGQVGFTGGMNIRAAHMPSSHSAHPIKDMHFRLTGPIVRHLQETFVADWEFMTSESLKGEAWFPPAQAAEAECIARGIGAGPENHGDRIRLTMMGAVASAKKSVYIVTPYFLPDPGLVSALNTADLRGVNVQIVLPSRNNLALVQWASTAMLWQVLERGVQVWLSAPPFDHTKLMIVDGCWTLLGSSNWDPRSLRLNYEFNVECFDPPLAQRLTEVVENRIAGARSITLREVDQRRFSIRLRDGLARLLSPYL